MRLPLLLVPPGCAPDNIRKASSWYFQCQVGGTEKTTRNRGSAPFAARPSRSYIKPGRRRSDFLCTNIVSRFFCRSWLLHIHLHHIKFTRCTYFHSWTHQLEHFAWKFFIFSYKDKLNLYIFNFFKYYYLCLVIYYNTTFDRQTRENSE